MDNKFFLTNLWRWKIGLPETTPKKVISVDYESLKRSEWSVDFEQLMRNRLVMGAVRYGVMGHGCIPKGKPTYDRIESIRKRLNFFEESGNAEYLVDIANIALLIFEERQHPNFHFEAKDDGYHCKVVK